MSIDRCLCRLVVAALRVDVDGALFRRSCLEASGWLEMWFWPCFRLTRWAGGRRWRRGGAGRAEEIRDRGVITWKCDRDVGKSRRTEGGGNE
eukprot:8710405-Pyramimonas_sp.AAC.1